MAKVAVIGAGVIGLSSALHVLDTCPSAEVTIFAESFPPNTTTNVSAGLWRPHILGDTPVEQLRKWSGSTLAHMKRLAWSDIARDTGAVIRSGYELSAHENKPTPFWTDIVDNFRRLNMEEISIHPGMRSGFFFTTALLQPGPYLEFLMKRIQRKGGKMIRRRISSFCELHDEGYDVIVNCAGLGARDIVNDTEMEPVRGQIIRTKAPWLSHFYAFREENDDLCYIIPGMSYVVVGGTADIGVESLAVSVKDTDVIWKRGIKYCPSLAVVVHNYGHGGGGVTLHWGCAEDAARLVKRALDNRSVKSRL